MMSSANNIVSTSSDIKRFNTALHFSSHALTAAASPLRFGLQSFTTQAPLAHTRQQCIVSSYSSARPEPAKGSALLYGPHNSTATSFPVLPQPLSPPVEIEDVLATIEDDPLFTQLGDDTSQTPYSQDSSTIPAQEVCARLSEEVNCGSTSGETSSALQYERQLNETNADQHCTAHSGNEQTVVVQADKRENGKRRVKDNKYWERRHKNNLAAKRSRAAKRNRQIVVEHTTELLRKENTALKAEVLSFREENDRLKRLLHFN